MPIVSRYYRMPIETQLAIVAEEHHTILTLTAGPRHAAARGNAHNLNTVTVCLRRAACCPSHAAYGSEVHT